MSADTEAVQEEQQEFGNSMRLLASLLDEPCPVGVPLVAKYRQGFGFKTIGHRLPIILTKVIDQLSRDKNEIGDKLGMEARVEVKTVIGALAKLKNEMQTNKAIYKIKDTVWDSYLETIAQRYFEGKVEIVNWYFAPWLFVECYMYRRLHEAFQLTRHLKDYDVFQKQKQEGWVQSADAASVLGHFIKSSKSNDETLEEILEISLWGNRCDLSISGGDENAQKHNIVEQLVELKKSILCDDSAAFWKYLRSKRAERTKTKPITIGYVLDNSGFELFTDLIFADALMNSVDRVDFHVKVLPWFISDALVQDFNWLIDSMANSDNPVLVELAQRWKSFISGGRWTIVESNFWTYPHAFFEMPKADPELYSRLQNNTLLVFKGDLNYRKLIGDINWLPETLFKEALQGFCPAPLIALRTIKADCIAGLTPGLANEINAKNPDWMVTGEYGIIQFCDSC